MDNTSLSRSRSRTNTLFYVFLQALLAFLLIYVAIDIFLPYIGNNYFTLPFSAILIMIAAIAYAKSRFLDLKNIRFVSLVAIWLAWFYMCLSFGGKSYDSYQDMIVAIAVTLVCAYFIIDGLSTRATCLLFVVFGISVFVTFAISMPEIEANSGLVREMAAGINKEGAKLGVGGYDFIYSLAFVFPALFLLQKAVKGLAKLVIWALLIVTAIYSFYCGLITTLLVVISSVALYLVIRIKRKAFRYLLMFILITTLLIIMLLGDSFFMEILKDLSEAIDSETIENKINDIILSISGQDEVHGTISGRVDRYSAAFTTFARSPIFGGFLFDNYKTSGGHSTMLDYMAISGIIGFGLFMAIMISIYKKTSAKLNNKLSRYVLWEAFVIFLVTGFLKAVNYASIMWTVAVFVPLVIVWADSLLTKRKGYVDEGSAN